MTVVFGIGILALVAATSVAGWVIGVRVRYGVCMRRLGQTIPRQGFRRAVRFYVSIFRSILLTGWWRLRAVGCDGRRPPPGEPTGPLVLCVHGFLAAGSCFWGLRRALGRRGRPTQAVSMGWPYRPIDAYVRVLQVAMEKIFAAAPGRPIDIVAHSMGGIVLRRVLELKPEFGAGVRRIVTLGTPHQGTPISRSLPAAPEVRQMARGSGFIRRLPDLRATAPGAEVTSVAAGRDLLVFPESATHLPGARSVTLEGLSHLGLLTEPTAIAFVVDLLGQASVEL